METTVQLRGRQHIAADASLTVLRFGRGDSSVAVWPVGSVGGMVQGSAEPQGGVSGSLRLCSHGQAPIPVEPIRDSM